MKQCNICEETKPEEEFYKDPRMKSGLSSECKVCKRQRSAAYKNGNYVPRGRSRGRRPKTKPEPTPREILSAEERAKRIRNSQLKKYGITQDQFLIQAAAQDNKCAICGVEPRLLHVDHCHESGKVRGLICNDCNVGLGRFKDKLDLVEKAAEYLSSGGRWDSSLEFGEVS